MIRHSTKPELGAYIDPLFAPEDKTLQQIRQHMRADKCENMSLAPHEGRLLQVLMRLAGVQSVVEIGMLYGYSAMWMLRALPPGGQLIGLEKDARHLEVTKKYLQAEALQAATQDSAKKLQFFEGPALQSLQKLQGPFDMVFIDANKSGYNDYLDWAENNIKPGGLIVGDNTFLFGHLTGKPWDGEVSPNMLASMQSFNQRLADTTKYTSVLIPTGEGLTVAIKQPSGVSIACHRNG